MHSLILFLRSFCLNRIIILLGLLLTLILADPPPYGEKDILEYDYGEHGIYPEIKYKSTDLVSPHVLWRKKGPQCDKKDHYYFLCPRGLLVGHGGPLILDSDGQMVWHNEEFPISYGLTVQKYRGERYLTFWSGNDQVIGHGSGNYFMLDKHYKQYKMISAHGHLTGDLHEFKITRDNTALLTSYHNVPWDLSSVGKSKDSWIWECYFQEINIETNELLFEWKATEHFTFDDCYNPVKNMGQLTNPWDWFHINGIEKDSKGNYIVSARYSHSLSYISGTTGEVLWQLGGRNNSFKDLSDGKATNFAWQHDVRWIEEFKSLTVFDNAAYFDNRTSPARGLVIGLNLDKMEAKLLSEVVHPEKYVSESQGSLQNLPDKNLFVGYGSAAAMTEFNRDGEVICDAQYGALHYHKDRSFSPSAVMSYRTYKHKWVGFPSEDPKIVFENDKVFVSWNGATELKKWRFEATNYLGFTETDWKEVISFERTGFESNATVREKEWNVWRVTAFDSKEHKLGMWIMYSGGDIRAIPHPKQTSSSLYYFLIGSTLTLLVLTIFRRRGEIIHRLSRSAVKDYLPLHKYSNGSTNPILDFRSPDPESGKKNSNFSFKTY